MAAGGACLEGARRLLAPGDSIRISRGMHHAVLARTDLVFMEVQVGEDADGEPDKLRLAYGWKQILKLCAGRENGADTRREITLPDRPAAKEIPG